MKTKTIQKQVKGTQLIFSGDFEEMQGLCLYLYGIGATDKTEPTSYGGYEGYLFLDLENVIQKLAGWKMGECTDFLRSNAKPMPKKERIAKAQEMAMNAAKHWISSLPDSRAFQNSTRGIQPYSVGVTSGLSFETV